MEHILDDIIFDNNFIVVGVSAGPDSMCLLDILEKKTNKIVVCHINHNVRKESITEEKYLKKYCKEHSLIFECMKIENYKENNFENEARKKRYAFYEETLKKFNNAINKGLEFVLNNDETTTAEVILPQFKDSSLNDLSRIVARYKESDSWLKNTTISEESYKNLEDLMIENNLLDTYVPFKELVKNFNE